MVEVAGLCSAAGGDVVVRWICIGTCIGGVFVFVITCNYS